MIWFLNERVLDHEIQCSWYTKRRTTADGFQILDASAFKNCATAIV